MKIEIRNINRINIAEVISEDIIVHNGQDALDILGNASYQGANKVILHKKNITPELFDLKTGIAGEVFQKCSNYRMQMAIVGDFSKIDSKSLQDFIRESNRYGQINFVPSTEDAINKLAKS